MSPLYELLVFPERAENLRRYDRYRAEFDHWQPLFTTFKHAFRDVYESGNSRVLLVHAPQGAGKTLFTRHLEDGYQQTRGGAAQFDPSNLWHCLVQTDAPRSHAIELATHATTLRRVEPGTGWRARERAASQENKTSRVRILLLDDFHRSGFIQEWAGLSADYYAELRNRQQEGSALYHVGEELVADCRGDFQATIFVLLSNQRDFLERLRVETERSHKGLAHLIDLPLPSPAAKEKIVRTNLNRLNRVSYWSCLDAAEPDTRSTLHDSLTSAQHGFTDSFQRLRSARQAGVRTGRPSKRNLLTLVTLGVKPARIETYLAESEIENTQHFLGSHLGSWWLDGSWATPLALEEDAAAARQAALVESEFWLRWVALDPVATYALCRQPPSPGDEGARLLESVRAFPAVGRPQALANEQALDAKLDADLAVLAVDPAVETFWKDFHSRGQQRAPIYENAVRSRLSDTRGYSTGLAAYGSVKPDLIEAEYVACAVTGAASREPDAIRGAIARSAHVIEFTAFLGNDLREIGKYLLEKVGRYAELLEAV